jgi:hypothetical protein
MATVALVDQNGADLFLKEFVVDGLRVERSRDQEQYPELHDPPGQPQILRNAKKGSALIAILTPHRPASPGSG